MSARQGPPGGDRSRPPAAPCLRLPISEHSRPGSRGITSKRSAAGRRRPERRQARGRPVSRILSGVAPWMTIPLGLRSPAASSRQPGHLGAKLPCRPPFPVAARHPYSALLPVGLAVPVLLPVPRWALTPPFHPHPASGAVCSLWRFPWGCPRRALPGTVASWSPDFPRRPSYPKNGAMGRRGHPVFRALVPYAAPGAKVNGGSAPIPPGYLEQDEGKAGFGFHLAGNIPGGGAAGGQSPPPQLARQAPPSEPKRKARSLIIAMSVASSAPSCRGRNRSRKAESSTSKGASG